MTILMSPELRTFLFGVSLFYKIAIKTSQLYKMISGGSNDFVIFQLVYVSAKVHAELKCI